MKVSNAIKTNLKLLIRSKGALVALILGPLLLMVVAGMAFDSQNTYNLHVGTYAEKYSRDASTFVTNLKDNNFQVTKYSTSTQCIDGLKKGVVVACMIFTKEPNDELAVYIDYSKINLVDSLMSLLSSQLSAQSRISGANITKELLQRMENARSGIDETKPVIVSLTTHNEQSTRKINQMISSLKVLNLKVNQSLEVTALESEDNQFVEWLNSLGELANDLISEYQNTLDSVKEELDSSAIAEQEKQTILQILEDGETQLLNIQDRLSVSGQVSEQDLDELLSLTTETVDTLKSINTELDSLKSFRQEGVKDLLSIRGSLDQNLLKFVQLQNAINTIDASISGKQLETPENLLSPLNVKVQPITTSTKRFELLFPTLLMMVIMFSALLISSSLLMIHKHSPANLRTKLTPATQRQFQQGMLGATAIVVATQVLAVLAVGCIYFGSNLVVVLLPTILITLIAIILFSLIGLILGSVFAKESSAMLSATLLSAALLLFSDIILPLESFPAYIKNLFMLNPFMIGVFALKRIILFHAPLSFITHEMFLLGEYIAVAILLLAFANKTWGMQKYKKSFKRMPK